MLKSLQCFVSSLKRSRVPSCTHLLNGGGPSIGPVRYATSKGGGSSKNGRDSNPKMLGVKIFGGQWVEPGNIIVRQRGARYGIVESTQTVHIGCDYTISALAPGYVKFWHSHARKKNFIEVVRSPPGVIPVVKYPITRVKGEWDLEELDKIVLKAKGEGRPPPLVSNSIELALQKFREKQVFSRKAVEAGGRYKGLVDGAGKSEITI